MAQHNPKPKAINKKPQYNKTDLCEECLPNWDRQGNVKNILLCDFHKEAGILLKNSQAWGDL